MADSNRSHTADNYRPQKEVTGWIGWAFFAGFLMLLAGIFQTIAGFVALFNKDVFIVNQNNLVVFNYNEWGWIHIVIGVVLILSAVSLFRGGLWGRIIGVTLASLSAIANFVFIASFPLWSITIIVLDILIIYAIAVHGSELRE